jgi:hypothetical protein
MFDLGIECVEWQWQARYYGERGHVYALLVMNTGARLYYDATTGTFPPRGKLKRTKA